MVDYPGRFAWYELMTTDIASAKAFYAKVVGWGAQDASTPGLTYTLFTSGKVPVSGVMGLPEEATRPRIGLSLRASVHHVRWPIRLHRRTDCEEWRPRQ